MKIEVLYVADCPSLPAALSLVRGELAAQGVAAEIDEILVADDTMARALRFCGSPTIRVNGRDVAGEPQQGETFGMCCRLFPGTGAAETAKAEAVRRAVAEAREAEQR